MKTSEFLKDSENTGRYIIKDIDSGKLFFVEPIGFTKTNWGDIDPATNKVTGSYGRYRGSVNEKDSLITEENGFTNIRYGNPTDLIRNT